MDELIEDMALAIAEVDAEKLLQVVSSRGFFIPSGGPYYVRIRTDSSANPGEVQSTLLSLFRVRRDLCNGVLKSHNAITAMDAILKLSDWLSRGNYRLHIEGKTWFARLQVEMLARFGVAPYRWGFIFLGRDLQIN